MNNKRLKAEMWDKMQYLFRNYYDRMIHVVLNYEGLIDTEILKTVLICFTEKAPVLHSSFCGNPIKPYWEIKDYVIDDILTVCEVEHLDDEVDKFICQCIPVDSNVQYKVAVFNCKGKSTLAILINHMCFDGGDCKYFLKKLCSNYNAYIREGVSPIDIKSGSRKFEAVYSKLSEKEEKAARKLYKNISAVKDSHTFPFTPPQETDKTMINRCKLDKELFERFRQWGKTQGATVNDIMLAAYIHSLYELGNYDKFQSLTIPCMVDLRRHIDGGEEAGGLTNHTGFMQCTVPAMGKDLKQTLEFVIKSVQKSKKDKYMGLYSLPLLKLAYTVFPHIISEQAIKIGYSNPLIGMSNIGVLPADKLTLNGVKAIDGFVTGAVKYKPYMQLSLSTLNDEMNMTIAIRGNEQDKQIAQNFFDIMQRNINSCL